MSKKISLFFVLTTLIILISFPAYSQYEGKSRMKGVVTDQDGQPIEGVRVKLFSFRAHAGFETKTDKKGAWKAMWVRSGKWNLDFEKTGYESKKLSTTLKANSKILEIDVTLKKLAGLVIKKDLMKDFDRGNQLFSREKYDEALQIYKTILEEFPESYIINLNVGNCHFEKKEYEKAIEAYRKVLEKDAKNTKALISIGNSYSNMNQAEKAIEWYNKIEISKIDDAVVLYNIGIFHFNAGSTKDAIHFLKRSTEVQEDFLDGWYQLGMAYMGAGDNKAAIVSFENYLKYDTESEQAKQVAEILQAIKQ